MSTKSQENKKHYYSDFYQVTTSGVCRPEARDAELHRLGCHTLITGTLERHSLMIVTMLLVTTLVHGAAVITSFCLAR